MILSIYQPIEFTGEPGGNRTHDNLIKSHILLQKSQWGIYGIFVKLARTNQYVSRILSNLYGSNLTNGSYL